MTRNETIALVAGFVGLASAITAKIFFDKKNSAKLEEKRVIFASAHKIDQMVDEASVDNEKITTAEDKAVAKDLMVKSKAKLDSCSTLNQFADESEKFLKLYSDLTEGNAEKVQANLLYFKKISDEADRAADRKALELYHAKIMDQSYRHEIDKIREGRKVLEALLPDSYTIGRILQRVMISNKELDNNCTDE